MGFRASLSWVLPALTPTTRGSPAASDRTCVFEPALPRSTGLGPGGAPPFFPDVGGVEDRAGEVEQASVVEPVQDLLVQAAPDAGSGADQEPAVCGGLRYPDHDNPHLRKWVRCKRIGVRIARKGIESSERRGRRRWVIERTMSWLTGYRRLNRRYERHPRNYPASQPPSAAANVSSD